MPQKPLSSLQITKGNTTFDLEVKDSTARTAIDGAVPLEFGSGLSKTTASGTTTISAPEMTGATSAAAGEAGIVPAPAPGDDGKFLKGDGTWGSVGEVPTSTSADENKVLSVDSQGTPGWTGFDSDVVGTRLLDEHDNPVLDEESTQANPIYVYDANSTDQLWTGFAGKGFGATRAYADQDGNNIKATYAAKTELPDVMTGATVSSSGASGLVPAPVSGDIGKFLKGDGTWDNVDMSGKQDVLSFGYDANQRIVSIDNHDLAPSTDSTVFLASHGGTSGNALKAALNDGKAVMAKYQYGTYFTFGIPGDCNINDNKYQFLFLRKSTDTFGQSQGDIEFSSRYCKSEGTGWFGQIRPLTFKAPTAPGQVMKSYTLSGTSAVDWGLATINEVPASTAADEDKVLTVDSQGTPGWTGFDRDVFGTQLLDEHGNPVLDEESTQANPIYVYDANSTDQLLTGFAGKGFGAVRTYADQDGENIKATYAKKAELPAMEEVTNFLDGFSTVNIGGRTYRTTRIGNQEWLAENLDWLAEGLVDGLANQESPSHEYYPTAGYFMDDINTYGKYGRLYNWLGTEVVDTVLSNDTRLHTLGWHVPTKADYETLMANGSDDMEAFGAKLKYLNGWRYDYNGNDELGFSALPTGTYSAYDREPDAPGMRTQFWTMTRRENQTNRAYNFEVSYYTPVPLVISNDYLVKFMFIRLVRTVS